MSTFHRLPRKHNHTLRAWNAADELLASHVSEESHITLYNDRYGYLACTLNDADTSFVYDRKSQVDSLDLNLSKNNCSKKPKMRTVLESGDKATLGLCNAPPSISKLEQYIADFALNSTPDATMLVGFMTRHFTPTWIKLASKYFDDVSQSLATKKARLLILKNKKVDLELNLPQLHSVDHNQLSLQQYSGTFSESKVDQATAFLLEKLPAVSGNVLDLASGNGIIALHVHQHNKCETIYLIEDDFLSHESGKVNCSEAIFNHIWDYSLQQIHDNSLDFVVSNPPFHQGFEHDVSQTQDLLDQAQQKLKPDGKLIIVANSHLNYGSVLKAKFRHIEVLANNQKFEVLSATK